MSYPQEEQHLSQLSLQFDFKIQCNPYHMSLNKSKAVPHEVTVRGKRKNEQSSLKAANDATILARSGFPVSMLDNILPFLHSYDLFLFMTTIKICQKSLTHELVVKAVINYFRRITQSMSVMTQQSLH